MSVIPHANDARWSDHAHGKPAPPTGEQVLAYMLAEHLASWISGSTALVAHYRDDAEQLIARARAAGVRFELD